MGQSPTLRVCVFDLDGTLADSLRDVAEAFNECLELLGLPTRPVEEYRYMVGEGVPKLCERALGGACPWLLPRLIELARPRYGARVLRHTRPYAGVPELVSELKARGARLGVLSNKPHDLTERLTRALWPDGVFEAIQGYDDEARRKPDPQYLLRMCADLGAAAPAQACLIGDTPTDVETARRAAVPFIGVSWGFRRREDLLAAGAERVLDHPAEVFAALCAEPR
jgi:phosphoglycolate phosphatase